MTIFLTVVVTFVLTFVSIRGIRALHDYLEYRSKNRHNCKCRCYTDEGGPYGGAYLVPCPHHEKEKD